MPPAVVGKSLALCGPRWAAALGSWRAAKRCCLRPRLLRLGSAHQWAGPLRKRTESSDGDNNYRPPIWPILNARLSPSNFYANLLTVGPALIRLFDLGPGMPAEGIERRRPVGEPVSVGRSACNVQYVGLMSAEAAELWAESRAI